MSSQTDPMTTSQNEPPTESEDTSDNETELYAASAAENALTSSKSSEDDSEMDALAAAMQQASTTTVVETTSEEKQKDDDKPEMTKEEMVEEALNCPCIASMKEGPCGDPFIEAYRCFLVSETEPKGMDCMEQFKTMQGCIAEHPDEYNLDDDEEEEEVDISVDNKKDSSVEQPTQIAQEGQA